jgi:hypothetical protein
MKSETEVNDAGVRSLASSMIIQAIADVKNKNAPIRQLDAYLWLTSPDFEFWCDVAGVYLDIYKILPKLKATKGGHTGLKDMPASTMLEIKASPEEEIRLRGKVFSAIKHVIEEFESVS